MSTDYKINIALLIASLIFFGYHVIRNSTPVTEYGTLFPGIQPSSKNLYDQYLAAAVSRGALPSDEDCRDGVGLENIPTRVLLAKAHQVQMGAKGQFMSTKEREVFSGLRRRLLLRGVRIKGTRMVHESHAFSSMQQFQEEIRDLMETRLAA